ncbi:M24 family metallopeptidase [Natronococcus sp. JC468]|uniref:M24 family metallopeptidase n=1 Tax=Natronococcus sp. JC468 TaxID=1961921 RepID=UPI00143AF93F|nr:M24 family metallopeptidase [Natronococcus sp. JC468]NKE37697.1 M24 family metallopeptidase [Natronococcus sp. JC468]
MDKHTRLERALERRDLDSIWFARPNAFAWLTGGNNVVDREGDAGDAAVGFDGEFRVVTNDIEADRIEVEELPDLEDAAVERYPWYDASLAEAIADRTDGERAAADIDVPGLETVDPTALRQPLTGRDRERYRELGRETARALESVCRELEPDDTEREVATALRVGLSARGIETPVVLVGGGERARRYRHYTPTTAELGDYALVSVTAQRRGLHASCTRTVAFDPPAWLEERHRVAARVETTALAATRQAAKNGGTAGDVFGSIRDAYADAGYDGEWKRHHQGGAAGFAGREWIATPGHDAAVRAPMAYAWNPTVQGAKSEDTALVDDDVEVLTTTGEWPTLSATAAGGDLELERPAVLGLADS